MTTAKGKHPPARSRRGSASAKAPTETAVAGGLLDLDYYVPTVLSGFVDRLRASTAQFFRDRFGINSLEWKILTFLASYGPANAYRIWNAIGADKAAVSRGVKLLVEKGLVVARDAGGARRQMLISLTARGKALQASSVEIILERQRRLIGTLTDADIEWLIKTVRYLEAHIPDMDGAASGRGPAMPKTDGKKRKKI